MVKISQVGGWVDGHDDDAHPGGLSDFTRKKLSWMSKTEMYSSSNTASALTKKQALTKSTSLLEQRGEQHPQAHAHVGPQILSSVLTGSGKDGDDLPTTDFERQVLRSGASCSETAEEPLTQAAEVQLQCQVANLRQSGHIYRHDDVAIRTIAENSDERVFTHTQK
ncbi:uncharacterized protein [Dermacentor albipictus]|uniref:uncharacterized protein isoform X2 n=1 Tax=Dermacentor albipictus TaxID=60249 RepID=UPI0038FD20D8